MDLWLSVLKDDCRGDPRCADEAAILERLDLDGYFASLAEALGESRQDLERENIMDMILSAFSGQVMTELGEDRLDRWATTVAAAHVPGASYEQVMDFAGRLQDTWVGLTPGVVARLRDYAGGPGNLTSDQRTALEALVEKRFSDE